MPVELHLSAPSVSLRRPMLRRQDVAESQGSQCRRVRWLRRRGALQRWRKLGQRILQWHPCSRGQLRRLVRSRMLQLEHQPGGGRDIQCERQGRLHQRGSLQMCTRRLRRPQPSLWFGCRWATDGLDHPHSLSVNPVARSRKVSPPPFNRHLALAVGSLHRRRQRPGRT